MLDHDIAFFHELVLVTGVVLLRELVEVRKLDLLAIVLGRCSGERSRDGKVDLRFDDGIPVKVLRARLSRQLLFLQVTNFRLRF